MKINQHILVTGGAGYIGSHACKALARVGYTPVTYDNLIYGHQSAVKWGPFEQGDIADRVRLNEVIGKYKPCAVMHFAAYAYVGESVENPAKYYRNNVVGTLTLLEVMRDFEIDKIIFSSTCATYGVPNTITISEDHPQIPINPYGHSKLMIEQILKDFYTAYGLSFISLRYFNAAGADLDGEIGEVHDPECHLIPLVMKTALGIQDSISIYGDDYNTPDGSCIRDYIHVTDLADAHVRALDYLIDNVGSKMLNLGTSRGYSVKEVIETAKKVTGKRIQQVIKERRAGDPAKLVATSGSAKKILDWNPIHSDIENIIKTAWMWHSKL